MRARFSVAVILGYSAILKIAIAEPPNTNPVYLYRTLVDLAAAKYEEPRAKAELVKNSLKLADGDWYEVKESAKELSEQGELEVLACAINVRGTQWAMKQLILDDLIKSMLEQPQRHLVEFLKSDLKFYGFLYGGGTQAAAARSFYYRTLIGVISRQIAFDMTVKDQFGGPTQEEIDTIRSAADNWLKRQ